MRQQTLNNSYTFEGKGLHTGTVSHMTVCPAPENTGVIFRRTDVGIEIPALAENVTNTARSTTISSNGVEVHTIEHLMSALTGMGVDNAIVEIDNVEVPILDGSARFYVEAFQKDGLKVQTAERKYIEIKETIDIRDAQTGSWIRLEPSEKTHYEATLDFGSKVLGVQEVQWREGGDYARQIGPCRTFVFFHEIEYLFANNLIKGGDVDNAIVIVEYPVSEEQLDRMSASMNRPKLEITGDGYLNNLELHFPNECGRHKLLDLIGDLRLSGGFLKADISAFKPGHTINTNAAKAVRKLLSEVK